MVTYIVRRLVTAALILLGASFLVYLLTAASGDPLEEFRASNPRQQSSNSWTPAPTCCSWIRPRPSRYFKWFAGASNA